jgi:hypothetical protein
VMIDSRKSDILLLLLFAADVTGAILFTSI